MRIKIQSYTNIGIIFSLLCFFVACTKSKEGCTFQNYSIPTNFNHYAFQKLNDSVFFIGTGKLYDSGFVYKSTNGGATWNLIGSNLYGGIYGIQFINNQEGYATAWFGNIYKTVDGGKSYSLYSKKIDNIITSPISINDSTIVAVSHIGYGIGYFWYSKDKGKTWDTVGFDRNLSKVIQVQNKLYMAGYGMVYSADLSFNQWKGTVVKGDLWVDIDFVSKNTGFITGFDGSIRKTIDGGISWTDMREGNHLLYKSYTLTQADFYNEHIGVVGTYQGDILYTGNGGYSWEVIKTPFGKTIRDIKMLHEKKGIAIGDQGLIFTFNLP